MSVLDKILAGLAPFDCLRCGREGELLCPACLSGLPSLPARCYRCHRPSRDYLTCVGCLSHSYLYRARPAAVYTGTAKDLIWRLKSDGAKSAARLMATRMVASLGAKSGYLIVPIPTATSRVRQRGYNQAALIARQFAKQTGLPLAHVLARQGQAHQVGAGREQRLAQLDSAFRVRLSHLVNGQNILLIDDVLTTGATLETAAQTLNQAGAARIAALTFAQPLMRDITDIDRQY